MLQKPSNKNKMLRKTVINVVYQNTKLPQYSSVRMMEYCIKKWQNADQYEDHNYATTLSTTMKKTALSKLLQQSLHWIFHKFWTWNGYCKTLLSFIW